MQIHLSRWPHGGACVTLSMNRFPFRLSRKSAPMLRAIPFLFGVLLMSTSISRAADKTGFIDKVFKDSAGEHKYVVFIPHDYKGDKEFPVILFLHGAGETKGGGK